MMQSGQGCNFRYESVQCHAVPQRFCRDCRMKDVCQPGYDKRQTSQTRKTSMCTAPVSRGVWVSKESGNHLFFSAVYCRLTSMSNSASLQKGKQITVPRRRKPFSERSHTGCTLSTSATTRGPAKRTGKAERDTFGVHQGVDANLE